MIPTMTSYSLDKFEEFYEKRKSRIANVLQDLA
jgi:hypothetical protein